MTRALKGEAPYMDSTYEVNEYQTTEGGSPLTVDRITTLMTNLVLQTAYIDGLNKPMSLLLVSIAGSGKTRILQPLQRLNQVTYTNDITPKFLVDFLNQVDRGEKRFLVIPDYISCLSHGRATVATLNSILRSMMEEGVTSLRDFGLDFMARNGPVRAGVLTAITIGRYEYFRESWKTTGFLSRFLPFSFTHTEQTQQAILDRIVRNYRNLDLSNYTPNINTHPQRLTEKPELFNQLKGYSLRLSDRVGSLPYRQQIQLQALTEASAILRGDSEIRQTDIDTVVLLSSYINYEFKAI